MKNYLAVAAIFTASFVFAETTIVQDKLFVGGNVSVNGTITGNGIGLTNLPITNAVIGILEGRKISDILSTDLNIEGDFGITLNSSDGDIYLSPNGGSRLIIGAFETFVTNDIKLVNGVFRGNGSGLTNLPVTNAILTVLGGNVLTNIVSPHLSVSAEFGIALNSSDGDIAIDPKGQVTTLFGSSLNIFSNQITALGNLTVGGTLSGSSGDFVIQSGSDIRFEASGNDVNVDNANLRVDGDVVTGGIYQGNGSGITNIFAPLRATTIATNATAVALDFTTGSPRYSMSQIHGPLTVNPTNIIDGKEIILRIANTSGATRQVTVTTNGWSGRQYWNDFPARIGNVCYLTNNSVLEISFSVEGGMVLPVGGLLQ